MNYSFNIFHFSFINFGFTLGRFISHDLYELYPHSLVLCIKFLVHLSNEQTHTSLSATGMYEYVFTF
jgi:hypothetical protein